MLDMRVPVHLETELPNGVAVQRRAHVEIRPLEPDDLGYIRAKWRECHHKAPGKRRLPWAVYKLTFGGQIDRLLEREDTWILGAYDDAGMVRGFIAWSGTTVHYVWTRPNSVRQGLALRLIEAAQVGPRFWYTFRGARAKGERAMDEVMVEALAARGVTATFMAASKYLGGVP